MKKLTIVYNRDHKYSTPSKLTHRSSPIGPRRSFSPRGPTVGSHAYAFIVFDVFSSEYPNQARQGASEPTRPSRRSSTRSTWMPRSSSRPSRAVVLRFVRRLPSRSSRRRSNPTRRSRRTRTSSATARRATATRATSESHPFVSVGRD